MDCGSVMCCGDVVVIGIVVSVLVVIEIVVKAKGVGRVCEEIVGEAISISMPGELIVTMP